MSLTDAERLRNFDDVFNSVLQDFEYQKFLRYIAKSAEERELEDARVNPLSTELDLQCEMFDILNLVSSRRVRCPHIATQAVRLFKASDELALFCEEHAAEGWLLG
jgi:hypothetical protein